MSDNKVKLLIEVLNDLANNTNFDSNKDLKGFKNQIRQEIYWGVVGDKIILDSDKLNKIGNGLISCARLMNFDKEFHEAGKVLKQQDNITVEPKDTQTILYCLKKL